VLRRTSGHGKLKVCAVFKLERYLARYTLGSVVPKLIICGAVVLAVLALHTPSPAISSDDSGQQATNDPRDDLSPWGVASGAEWFSAYPIFNPMLKQAGVRWLRGFYEWQTIEPARGHWNFALPDHLVENARTNRIHLTGVLAYLAPWSSTDGSTRKFPIKDIQFWRDYVAGMVGRYHSDIKYWEVWNEFNGSFAQAGTPGIYAELVREASIAAKKIDPTAKIGLSVANFDVGFLDAAIKAGAASYFDFICVHPYEILSHLSDQGEPGFLSMATTLRKMLEANHEPEDIPLWITEIGSAAPVKRNDALDRTQAALLAKAYLLSIASGFKRVFWFEARGPSYGHEMDLGLIRSDMTSRPSYQALRMLTSTLGPEPKPAGWLDLGNGGYGFLFENTKDTVLAAWSPAKREINLTFESNVRLSDLTGESTLLAAGKTLTLTETPVFITGLPTALIEEGQKQKMKPYPWGGGNNSGTSSVTALLKAANVENGIRQVNLDTTIAAAEWRRPDFSRPDSEGHYVYFWIDPQFAPFGTKKFDITAIVRRIASDKIAGLSINYESSKGYVNSDYRNIPEGDDWKEMSWKVEDANFAGAWGWSIRLNAISSPNEFLVKEIKVRKSAQ
jgi:polysaccharide biosynthesis protein PslG